MVTVILRQTINFIFYWQFKDLPLFQMTCNDIMMSVIACYEECVEQTILPYSRYATWCYHVYREIGVLLQLHSSIEFTSKYEIFWKIIFYL